MDPKFITQSGGCFKIGHNFGFYFPQQRKEGIIKHLWATKAIFEEYEKCVSSLGFTEQI